MRVRYFAEWANTVGGEAQATIVIGGHIVEEPNSSSKTNIDLAAVGSAHPNIFGETPPYVMAQMRHADPTMTLGFYAKAMDRRDGEPERLKALVEGEFGQRMDSEDAEAATTGVAAAPQKLVVSGSKRP